jgi:hypothetical protein
MEPNRRGFLRSLMASAGLATASRALGQHAHEPSAEKAEARPSRLGPARLISPSKRRI